MSELFRPKYLLLLNCNTAIITVTKQFKITLQFHLLLNAENITKHFSIHYTIALWADQQKRVNKQGAIIPQVHQHLVVSAIQYRM